MVHATAAYQLHATLALGGTIVLLPRGRVDGDEICAAIEHERVAVLSVVGDVVLRRIVDALEAADARGAPYDISSLLRVHSSGAMVQPPTKDALHAPRFDELLRLTRCERGRRLRALAHDRARRERQWALQARHERARARRRWTTTSCPGPVNRACSRWPCRPGWGTTTTRRGPQRRSARSTAPATPYPVTGRCFTTTARSRCSVAVPVASTPAARKCGRKKSRSRSRLTRLSSTRSWSACPTTTGARWSRRSSPPPPTPGIEPDELAEWVGTRLARLQASAASGRGPRGAADVGRKARLRRGRARSQLAWIDVAHRDDDAHQLRCRTSAAAPAVSSCGKKCVPST